MRRDSFSKPFTKKISQCVWPLKRLLYCTLDESDHRKLMAQAAFKYIRNAKDIALATSFSISYVFTFQSLFWISQLIFLSHSSYFFFSPFLPQNICFQPATFGIRLSISNDEMNRKYQRICKLHWIKHEILTEDWKYFLVKCTPICFVFVVLFFFTSNFKKIYFL